MSLQPEHTPAAIDALLRTSFTTARSGTSGAELALERLLTSGASLSPQQRVQVLSLLVRQTFSDRAGRPARYAQRLQQLAAAQAATDDLAGAEKSLGQLLAFVRTSPVPTVDPLHTRLDLAEIYSLQGKNNLAEHLLSQVFESGSPSLQGVAKIRLGDIYCRLGNHNLGIPFLEEGLDESRQTDLDAVNIGLLRFRAAVKLAHYFLDTDDREKGVRYTRQVTLTANSWISRGHCVLSPTQQTDVRTEALAVLGHCVNRLERDGQAAEARALAAEQIAFYSL